MKKLLSIIILTCISCVCFAQKNLISFEDLKYLVHNNLQQADTFLVAKGYTSTAKNVKKKNRTYSLDIKGGMRVRLSLRADGRRLFLELETNSVEQYDLINNSISQYIHTAGTIGDIQTYAIKDFGNIYITVNDVAPYNPLKRNYTMQIVSDKSITAYD